MLSEKDLRPNAVEYSSAYEDLSLKTSNRVKNLNLDVWII